MSALAHDRRPSWSVPRPLPIRTACAVLAWFLTLAVGVVGVPFAAAVTATSSPPSSVCPAGAVIWASPVDGQWGDPTKWSSGAVPGAGEDVCITAVRSDGAPYTVRVQGTHDLRSLRIGSGGPRVQVQAGWYVDSWLRASADVVVSGALVLGTDHSSWGSGLAVGGSVRVISGGTLRLAEDSGGVRYLRGAVLNEGTLEVTTTTEFDGPAGSTLVNAGAMTVAADRTLTVQEDRSFVQRGGTLALTGRLFVRGGAFTYEGGTASGRAAEVHNSRLAFTAAPPAPLAVLARHSNQLLSDVPQGVTLRVLSGWYTDSVLRSATGFTNAGTIDLDTDHSSWWARIALDGGQLVNAASGVLRTIASGGGGRALNADLLNRGLLDLQQGLHFDGTGATLTNEGTITVAEGKRLHVHAGRTLTQRSGSLSNAGEVFIENGAVRYEGGAVTGNRLLLHGSTLAFTGAVPPQPLRVNARYVTTLQGDVPARADVRVLSGWYTDSVLRSATGFTNAGTIDLDTDHSSWWARIALDGGQLVNEASGVLRTSRGNGGTRAVGGSLLNRGLLDLQQGLHFDGPDSTLTNEGTITVADGMRLHVGGGRTLTQRTGSLANGGEVFVENATLRYEGGAVTGNRLLLHGSTVAFTGSVPPQPLRLTARYATTLLGDVPRGADIRVLSGWYTDSVLRSATGFTNAGTIELATDHSSWPAQLDITSGRLTHAAGGVLRALGGGGSRVIQPGTTSNGVLDPEGDTALTLMQDLIQGSTGSVDIRVRTGDADRLHVTGSTTLSGTLRLSTAPGYSPPIGTSHRVVTTGSSLSGTFDTVRGGQLYDGRKYDVRYGANYVDVGVVEAPAVSNAAPTGSLTTAGVAGDGSVVIGAAVSAVITGADAHDDVLTWHIDWGDGSTAGGELPMLDAPTHRYGTLGDKTITATVSDGVHSAAVTKQVRVTLSGPLTADAGPDLNLVAGDSAVLDGGGSTPAADITSHVWTLSDGRTLRGPLHVVEFSAALTEPLTATLTVTAAGTTATDSAVINVRPVPTEAGLRVTVTDGNGGPVSGARLMVLNADGSQVAATSGSDGVGRLHGLDEGTHTVYVLADGYRPDEVAATVTDGSGAATLSLVAGGIAAAALESAPMTAAQAEAAGIDTKDPDNYNVYEFEVVLAFDGLQVPFNGYVAQGGGGQFVTGGGGSGGTTIGGSGSGSGGGSCAATGCTYSSGGSTVQVQVKYIANTPTLLYMVIPGKAKWLKEFYDVRMAVTNLGSPSFTLVDGAASLELPSAGLSLPALNGSAQSAEIALADIPGGQTKNASWVVRGDVPGSYGLTARYTGLLQPMGAQVELAAVSAAPIRVWGLDAVAVTVDADSSARKGEPYNVAIHLRNTTSGPDAATIHNVGMSFGQGEGYTYLPGQAREFSIASLAPGQALTARLTLLPHFSGTLRFAEVVSASGGGRTEGAAEGPALTPVPALSLTGTGAAGGVDLKWTSVSGAQEYLVHALQNVADGFGEPLLRVTGSATSASVRDLPEGATRWFALLTRTADGLLLKHAVVEAATGRPAPETPLPGLSVGDVTVVEGAQSHVVDVPLTLTRAHTAPVIVKLTTANGTALAGSDYTALTTTAGSVTSAGVSVTIPTGQTQASVPVTVLGDALGEVSETFGIKAAATGVTLEDAAGTVRLVEDDGPVFARVGDAHSVEGSSSAPGSLDFPVTLSRAPAPGQTVSLALSTAPGTALAASDFVARSSVVTFAAGETTGSFPVTLVGDATTEPNEALTVKLALSGSQPGVVVADTVATGTIVNDDGTAGTPPLPSVALGDAWVLEGDGGTTEASFPVSLSRPSATDVVVKVTTANGTATAPADYTALTGHLVTIPAGSLGATFTVHVAGGQDATVDGELDETFRLSAALVSKNAVLGDAAGTATIADEEGLPVLSVLDAAGHEPAAGGGALGFTVRLSRPVPIGSTVAAVSTANGTALAGADYTALVSVPVVWEAGGLEQRVQVPLLSDDLYEGPQTLSLKVAARPGVVATDVAATGTVVDHQGLPTVSVADADQVAEGGVASFAVTLSGKPDRSWAVKWAAVGGTAKSGLDFTAASGVLTFAAGETSKTATVTTLVDSTTEPVEAFTVKLTPPAGMTATRAIGAGSIAAD